MKQLLSVPIPKDSQIFVKEEEKVEKGTVLAKGKKPGNEETISISEIFQIEPAQITKVLVKKIGDSVKKGEILAKKGNVLGRTFLKSPRDGFLSEISQALGEITISGKEEETFLKSPVTGKIKKITLKEIEIEFKGRVFEGKKGSGKQAFGQLLVLPEELSVLDLTAEARGKILMSQAFSNPVVAKAWALRASGLVGSDFAFDYLNLPYLVLGKRDLKALEEYQGKEVVLEPEEKRLIVLE